MDITLKTIDDNGNVVTVNQPATISLDKLSFNCKATDCLKKKLLYLITTRNRQIVNETVTLSPNFSTKERGYRYIIDVLFREEVYVQLALCPTMNVMPDDHIKIKVCNHTLYESKWVENVGEILRSLNLECHTITELHIALDSSEVVDRFLNLYYSPELQLVRTGLFGKLNKQKKLTSRNGFHFNKKVSDLYITFYDKSRDYLEKHYIKDFHELNSVGVNVQRIEVRARKVSTLKVNGFDWQDLGNQELLTQIFKAEFLSRIVFNHMGKSSFDKSRNRTFTKVFPIDIPSSCTVKTKTKCKPAIENMKAIKNTVKNIHFQAVLNPDEHNFLALNEMIARNNLEGWYKVKLRSWTTPALKLNKGISSKVDETLPMPIPKKSFEWWARKLLSKFIIIDLPAWKPEDLLPDYHIEMRAA